MSSPLLSVCIPTYNRARRLDMLLKALAVQLLAPGMEEQVEIVISDNASSDATQKIGEKWANQHAFFRYFRNPWNIGGDPNQLRAISRGTGKYAWVLGDDDHVRKDAIAIILSYLKPGVSQLFLNFRCVTVDGQCLIQSRLNSEIPDEITTVDLVKRLGYITVFALISSHIFDRKRFLSVDPEALLKVSPFYILNMALIMAFHDEKCVLVREAILDYTTGNDRLPDETKLYVRIISLLNTFSELEARGKIGLDFLMETCETGGTLWNMEHPHYMREELYNNLGELSDYWALPGRQDTRLIRSFVDRGPGFWPIRNLLKGFYIDDFNIYSQRAKPIIHHWRGKAWVPAFSILLSSDDWQESEAFDQLMAKWPEQFAHESILITRLSEEQTYFENIDVFMAPFRFHRAASASLNSGFRKVLGERVLVLDRADSPVMAEVIRKMEAWQNDEMAPESCLLFESMPAKGAGLPGELIGLYLKRDKLVFLGGFENHYENWTRRRLLADAAFRLSSGGWAMDGGKIPAAAMRHWFSSQLPLWLRVVRTQRKFPFSEHGLCISFRQHLTNLRAQAAT